MSVTELDKRQFDNTQNKGLIGPLGFGQLIWLAVLGVTIMIMLKSAPGGSSLMMGVVLILIYLIVMFVPVHAGLTLYQWLPIMAHFRTRQVRKQNLFVSDQPTAGYLAGGRPVPAKRPRQYEKLDILSMGPQKVGVIADRRFGAWTAVVRCKSGPFLLQEPHEQDRMVNAFGRVLAELARNGSPIMRVQWIERSVPEDSEAHTRWMAAQMPDHVASDPERTESYRNLHQLVDQSSAQHEVYLAVQIDERKAAKAIKAAGGGDAAATKVLIREVLAITDKLAECGVKQTSILTGPELSLYFATAFEPFDRIYLQQLSRNRLDGQSGLDENSAWPHLYNNTAPFLATGSGLHRTFHVRSWPKREVRSDFMANLLAHATCVRTVSVIFEPIDAARAMRSAGVSVTNIESTIDSKERRSFRVNSGDRKRLELSQRREEELVEGHSDIRFTGYITISADNEESLEEGCGEQVQQAGLSLLELVPMDMQHDEAFSYTLPLCRGFKRSLFAL